MKNYIITIDTGTTNTRVSLWNGNRNRVAVNKAEIGVRNTAIDGNNQRLKQAVRGGMDDVLKQQGITFQEIRRVIATGMITSDMGLAEVLHIQAPAGEKELAENAEEILMEDVCPVPILFIPGMKNHGKAVTLDEFYSMDMMRGEEVEAVAVLRHLPEGKAYLLVLPGSHTKFVFTDEGGKITGCLTSISGELLSAITKYTLIADAVGRSFVEESNYDRDAVLMGYYAAKENGFGRACFLARILNQFVEPDRQKNANYVLGAVLENDVSMVQKNDDMAIGADTTVIICGKNLLCRALADMFREIGFFRDIREFVLEDGLTLAEEGALFIEESIKYKC